MLYTGLGCKVFIIVNVYYFLDTTIFKKMFIKKIIVESLWP